MLKKIEEVVKKTVKYVKKGVKWIMEKKNELINNSLAVRVYENTREDVKEVARSASNGLRSAVNCFRNTNSRTNIALSLLGTGVALLVSSYLENGGSLYRKDDSYVEEDQRSC